MRPPPEFVAAWDQAQAEALDALRAADAFVVFYAVEVVGGLARLQALVACPPEMLETCRQLLEGVDE